MSKTKTGRMILHQDGQDESRFNVRDKVTKQCPHITISEDTGEPKRNRTEIFLLISRTTYR